MPTLSDGPDWTLLDYHKAAKVREETKDDVWGSRYWQCYTLSRAWEYTYGYLPEALVIARTAATAALMLLQRGTATLTQNYQRDLNVQLLLLRTGEPEEQVVWAPFADALTYYIVERLDSSSFGRMLQGDWGEQRKGHRIEYAQTTKDFSASCRDCGRVARVTLEGSDEWRAMETENTRQRMRHEDCVPELHDFQVKRTYIQEYGVNESWGYFAPPVQMTQELYCRKCNLQVQASRSSNQVKEPLKEADIRKIIPALPTCYAALRTYRLQNQSRSELDF